MRCLHRCEKYFSAWQPALLNVDCFLSTNVRSSEGFLTIDEAATPFSIKSVFPHPHFGSCDFCLLRISDDRERLTRQHIENTLSHSRAIQAACAPRFGGAPQPKGALLGSGFHKDYSILGSLLGRALFIETPTVQKAPKFRDTSWGLEKQS